MKKKIATVKTLTWFVVANYIVCIAFAVVVLVYDYKGIMVNDTLIQSFYMAFGTEFGATAAIMIFKTIIKRDAKNEKIKDIKENNLTLDKSDLNQTDNNDYYESGGTYYG